MAATSCFYTTAKPWLQLCPLSLQRTLIGVVILQLFWGNPEQQTLDLQITTYLVLCSQSVVKNGRLVGPFTFGRDIKKKEWLSPKGRSRHLAEGVVTNLVDISGPRITSGESFSHF